MTDTKDTLTNAGVFEIAPVAADLDGDRKSSLFAVSADQSAFIAAESHLAFKQSRLSVVKFRNGMFVKGTICEEIGTPIQGVAVNEGRVIFVKPMGSICFVWTYFIRPIQVRYTSVT